MGRSDELPPHTVLVAGDVTMDWNIAHRGSWADTSAASTAEGQTRLCWQRGGAALLGDLVSAMVSGSQASDSSAITVVPPAAPREMPRPGDPQFHQSYVMWAPFEPGVWRVQRFLGLNRAGAAPAAAIESATADAATVVVLDDANLGFRDTPAAWPRAIRSGTPRWIVLKMASPVAQGALWEMLLRAHAERLIVIVAIDDLRRTEVQISRQLSWERTAQDVVWELTHNPRVNGLSRCAHAVVSFGTSGGVVLSGGSEAPALLVMEASLIEGGWERVGQGGMMGNTATLTAAVARQLLLGSQQPDVVLGVQSGIAGMRRLYEQGYGRASAWDLAYPASAVAEAVATARPLLSVTPIQNPVRSALDAAASGGGQGQEGIWTILQDRYPDQLEDIAERIVLEGLDAALSHVPRAQIGSLVTIDRHEIEALRSIQNLIGEYCRHRQKRPLSIAVFGPPGSGKSFGVEQVAGCVCPGEIKSLTFNLSQFATPEELHGAFHQVRDAGLSGRIPLVFWDEFDTTLDGQPLGWLRYFLAPMQDGSFQQGEITHPIGRSIFVFAGGTSERFETFGAGPTVDRKAAKVPDFISRLKGYLNVLGPNRVRSAEGADPHYVIRRAILLRSLFARQAPHLFSPHNGVSHLNIDRGVLRAFLQTREYRHGIRSMESLIAMSTLSGKTTFERSSLPAQSQLEIHVDSLDFSALVQQIVLNDTLTELLAEAAHAVFCDGKVRDGWRWGTEKSEAHKTHPLLIPYAQLPEEYKKANRVTVRTIPQKLAMAGYVMIPARSNEQPLEFPGGDLERLAEFEHELWMQARLAAGFTLGTPTPANPRQNEYLVPWDQVPEAIRQIDRDLVRGIPRILARAGYAVVKLEAS